MINDKKLRRLLALLLALITTLALLAACSGDEDATTDEDEVAWKQWNYVRDPSLPDFATMVTLDETGIDADFDQTGKGLVTVEQFIDGDTVHFYNKSQTTVIKTRFLAVDTPESTGRVQPWGKPASLYTKNKLKNAKEIVLESDTGNVDLDSTGSRYLAWVWYRNEGDTKWRNLNIELLSEGLAMGKSSSSTRYGEVASQALTSARSEKLHLFSGKKDPFYYYDATVVLDIKTLISDKEAYDLVKVRFEGVVTKASGGGVYVESYDEETKQNYGVYVYGGYASLAPKFLVEGYRLRITGTATNDENFGFQVSGLSFSQIKPTDDDTQILEKNVEVTPTPITGDELLHKESLAYTYVSMSNLTVTGTYTTAEGTSKGAITITCKTEDEKYVTVRTVVLTQDGETVKEDYFKGKTMNVRGIVDFYKGDPQLKLFSLDDVEFVG